MFLSVILLFSVFGSINGFNATLYSLPYYSGQSDTIISEDCVNIRHWLVSSDQGISGVAIQGMCVILYENVDCKGGHIIIRPGTLFHKNLDKVGFDNRAKSIGPCEIVRVETEIIQSFQISSYLSIALSIFNAVMFIVYLKDRNNEMRRRRVLNCPLPSMPSSSQTEEHSYQSVHSDHTIDLES